VRSRALELRSESGHPTGLAARPAAEPLRPPEMHLRLLRYFIAAAEEENFNRAADRLHIAQPALSRRIRDLEDLLGVALFERDRKRVRLSAAGRAFLGDARDVMGRVGQAAAHCRRLARAETNTLCIGVNDSALRHDKLSRALRDFHAIYGDVDLQVRPTAPISLLEAILCGEVDGAFIHTRPLKCDAVDYVRVAPDRFLLALPKAHRLSFASCIRLFDLRNEEFLWMPREAAPLVHDRMLEACKVGGLTPRIGQRLLSEASRLHLVAQGMGVTFVTESFVDFLPDKVVVREVKDFSIDLPLDFVWRHDNYSPLLARFVEVLAGLGGEGERSPATGPAALMI
jgi:DNA-binding transcriptional LysR family regulator